MAVGRPVHLSSPVFCIYASFNRSKLLYILFNSTPHLPQMCPLSSFIYLHH